MPHRYSFTMFDEAVKSSFVRLPKKSQSSTGTAVLTPKGYKA